MPRLLHCDQCCVRLANSKEEEGTREGGRVSDVSHLGAVILANERIVVHCSSPHLYHLSPLHSHREDLLPPLQQYDQFRQTAYLHCITHILTLHTITVSPSEMWRLYCKKLDIPCETHVVNIIRLQMERTTTRRDNGGLPRFGGDRRRVLWTGLQGQTKIHQAG